MRSRCMSWPFTIHSTVAVALSLREREALPSRGARGLRHVFNTAEGHGGKDFSARTAMLGTRMGPRAFLERVGEELLRIEPGEVKALADAIHDCYERDAMVFI